VKDNYICWIQGVLVLREVERKGERGRGRKGRKEGKKDGRKGKEKEWRET